MRNDFCIAKKLIGWFPNFIKHFILQATLFSELQYPAMHQILVLAQQVIFYQLNEFNDVFKVQPLLTLQGIT